MLHWPATRLVLAILVLHLCLVIGAEHAGVQTARAAFQLDEAATLSPAEHGKDQLISSLRKPEFLGTDQRNRSWDSDSASVVVSFNSLDGGGCPRDSSPVQTRQFQLIAVQVLLCVWLI